jgi:hypothetical protein
MLPDWLKENVMVGNIFSNAGLVARGMNAAASDTETLAQQRQATQTGAIGLEDLQRTQQEQEAQRSATRGAQSLHAMAIAKAIAAKQAGDAESFQQYATEAMQIPQQSAYAIAAAAVGGADESQIESIAERYMGSGIGFDKGSLKIESRVVNGQEHVFLLATKNGQPLPPRDATELYTKQRAAQAKPVALSKDQILVNPASQETLVSNVQPEAAASGLGDVYMKTGPEAGTVKSKGGPRQTISTTRTISSDGTQAQKELPMFGAVERAFLGYPGMAKTDVYGNTILTPQGSARAPLANQIAQSNRNLDPATIAAIAINGTPKTNPKTGEKAVLYKGKYYAYAEMPTSQTQQPTESTTTRESLTGGADEQPEGSFARGGKVNHNGMC